MTMTANGNQFPLANDKLRGVKAIAEYIGENVRRTFYLVSEGLIPARKEGGVWISFKSWLDAHYQRPAAA
jgi:hypothetical protein